jgi:hypothetical protein
MVSMFDNIDKKELTRLFLLSVVFIVAAYLLGRLLTSF